MRPIGGTMRIFVVAMLMLMGLMTAVPPASAKPGDNTGPGNSGAAHQCQKGGWQSLVREDGTGFANQGECVSYGAQGGTLADDSGDATVGDGDNTGDSGDTGDGGDTGDDGDTGNIGDSGDDGDTGNIGDSGDTGDTGDNTGNTGDNTGDGGDTGGGTSTLSFHVTMQAALDIRNQLANSADTLNFCTEVPVEGGGTVSMCGCAMWLTGDPVEIICTRLAEDDGIIVDPDLVLWP